MALGVGGEMFGQLPAGGAPTEGVADAGVEGEEVVGVDGAGVLSQLGCDVGELEFGLPGLELPVVRLPEAPLAGALPVVPESVEPLLSDGNGAI